MTIEQAKREADAVSGISNVTYDLVTIFQNKLKGIASMEVYKTDAEQAGDAEVQELLVQLERSEREDVERLRRVLAQRLQ